jgi:hypothetical protein
LLHYARFLGLFLTLDRAFTTRFSRRTEASGLIDAILLARGYPAAGFEQRAADVSVTYPRVMENYRMANSIAVRNGKADASTEELRTAMIQYRAIFDELIETRQPITTKAVA